VDGACAASPVCIWFGSLHKQIEGVSSLYQRCDKEFVARGAMSSSIWEQCGALLPSRSLSALQVPSATHPLNSDLQSSTLSIGAPPALPVAAALDLVGDFRVDDGFSWPKLNVAPKSRDEDLILDTGACLPSTVAKFLRPYQLEGVKFIHSHFVRGQGCILADDMGLGKTVQTIAFVYVILHKSGARSDADALALRNLHSPKILLVLPASVMYQWQGELDNWMCCSICIYHGSEASRRFPAIFTVHAFAQVHATYCSPP
jgi:SNF2 family DNA or RNA helicase